MLTCLKRFKLLGSLNARKSMKIMFWGGTALEIASYAALNCHEISIKPLVHTHSSLKRIAFTPAMQAQSLTEEVSLRDIRVTLYSSYLYGDTFSPVPNSASQKILIHVQKLSAPCVQNSSVFRIMVLLYQKIIFSFF